jgi:subtilisin family serine protease
MAAPHVAGVAALIVNMGLTAPGAVAAGITNRADPMDRPVDLSIYEFFPSVNNGAPQVCHGGPGYNGFYGHGQANALSAVTTAR